MFPTLILSVEILSGQHIPRPHGVDEGEVIDPYVEVNMSYVIIFIEYLTFCPPTLLYVFASVYKETLSPVLVLKDVYPACV